MKSSASASAAFRMALQSPVVWMGILNTTPDSFSDGGQFECVDAAVRHAKHLVQSGATIIDVGAVSTRPNAASVSTATEIQRLSLILPALKHELPTSVLASLDTSHPKVAAAFASQGLIHIINDVFAGQKKTEAGFSTFDIAAQYDLAMVLMHMQGTPATMQRDPTYQNCVQEVTLFLKKQADAALRAGVKSIALDPGIGFGKLLADNLDLLSHTGIKRLCDVGFPVAIGLSRKSFLNAHRKAHNQTRLASTIELDIESKKWEQQCIQFGAKIIRTHALPNAKDVQCHV